jgi:hypothetical protein
MNTTKKGRYDFIISSFAEAQGIEADCNGAESKAIKNFRP